MNSTSLRVEPIVYSLFGSLITRETFPTVAKGFTHYKYDKIWLTNLTNQFVNWQPGIFNLVVMLGCQNPNT